MSSLRVGQLVVCVDDSWKDAQWQLFPDKPICRRIYAIRDLEMGWRSPSELYVRLEELHNPITLWSDGTRSEVMFCAWRFRPVKETSIEIFRKLVAPIDGEKVRA